MSTNDLTKAPAPSVTAIKTAIEDTNTSKAVDEYLSFLESNSPRTLDAHVFSVEDEGFRRFRVRLAEVTGVQDAEGLAPVPNQNDLAEANKPRVLTPEEAFVIATRISIQEGIEAAEGDVVTIGGVEKTARLIPLGKMQKEALQKAGIEPTEKGPVQLSTGKGHLTSTAGVWMKRVWILPGQKRPDDWSFPKTYRDLERITRERAVLALGQAATPYINSRGELVDAAAGPIGHHVASMLAEPGAGGPPVVTPDEPDLRSRQKNKQYTDNPEKLPMPSLGMTSYTTYQNARQVVQEFSPSERVLAEAAARSTFRKITIPGSVGESVLEAVTTLLREQTDIADRRVGDIANSLTEIALSIVEEELIVRDNYYLTEAERAVVQLAETKERAEGTKTEPLATTKGDELYVIGRDDTKKPSLAETVAEVKSGLEALLKKAKEE